MTLREVSNSSISHPFWRFPLSIHFIGPILALQFLGQYMKVSTHNLPPHPALFSRMYCHAQLFYLFMVIYSNKFLFTHCNFRRDFSLINAIAICSDICKEMFFCINLKFVFQKQRFIDPYTFQVERYAVNICSVCLYIPVIIFSDTESRHLKTRKACIILKDSY